MITRIELRGFKRFGERTFELAPLTVLAGLNGTGKTSFIQSLLVMRLAARAGAGGLVPLNGALGLELGSAGDIRHWGTDGALGFSASDCAGSSAWSLDGEDDALCLSVHTLAEGHLPAFGPGPRVFTYLSAERLGPRLVLGAASLPDDALEVGIRGEHSAQLLYVLGDRPVEDRDRVHPETGDDAPLLKYQVERWLREVARPVELKAERVGGATVTALSFRSPGGDWVRAPNMGFGVSYALPVVLAGLTAAPGGLLVVENPEAHLHPRGQSRIGTFLAWLAARGIQVVLETHSDHVLNGIRRAVGERQFLPATSALVHYFDDDEEGSSTALRLTATGGLSAWPRGFFDQYQDDVAALGRVRRRG